MSGIDASILDALGVAADVVTVVGGLTLLAGLVVFRQGLSRFILTRARRRHLRGPMTVLGGSASFSSANRAYVADVASRAEARSPAEQLIWLGAATNPGPDALPVAYRLAADRPDALRSLAGGYRAVAGALALRAAVGSSTSLLDDESRRTRDTADLLERYADGAPISDRRAPVTIRRGDGCVELHAMTDPDAAIGARDLMVSWSPTRAALAGDDWSRPGHSYRGNDLALPCSPTERDRARAATTGPNRFDGVVPRLLEWRIERDRANGRERVHLALAETRYSACLLDHHRPPDGDHPDAAGIADAPERATGTLGLMTISLGLVTADNRLAFVTRSATTGSHRRLLAPAVNGNLEFQPRAGIEHDHDRYGLPDPRRAIAREAREELGVTVDPGQLVCAALARFSDAREHGTWLLVLAGTTSSTLDDLRGSLSGADPLEGRWEHTGVLEGLPIPATAPERAAAAQAVMADGRYSSHALATALAVLGETATRSVVQPT